MILTHFLFNLLHFMWFSHQTNFATRLYKVIEKIAWNLLLTLTCGAHCCTKNWTEWLHFKYIICTFYCNFLVFTSYSNIKLSVLAACPFSVWYITIKSTFTVFYRKQVCSNNFCMLFKWGSADFHKFLSQSLFNVNGA